MIAALSARLAAHLARLVCDPPAQTRSREPAAVAPAVRPSFTSEPQAAAATPAE
jgi:hypothetical protein